MFGDPHSELAALIKADFGEVMWRDRTRLGQAIGAVSPITGHSHLYDAVAARKLSAVRWLVRLGGRVRERQQANDPWRAALQLTDPVQTLELLLTSGALSIDELGECANDLRALERSTTRPAIAAGAYKLYLETCRRIEREPDPPTPTPVAPAERASLVTFSAAGPFWPWTTSNSTRSPSASDLNPLP